MRYLIIPVMVFALQTACTSPGEPAKKYYSENEKAQLTFCVGMSDTIKYTATKKLNGAPKKQMVDFYSANQKNSKLNLAMVERVYNANFTSAWDYTIAFFSECANNMAGVNSERINFASYCVQNGMIAETAHAFKKSGAAKEKAYDYFKKFKSETPNKIIDNVYSKTMTRVETKLDAWKTCMSRL